jgi:hypothetical protein
MLTSDIKYHVQIRYLNLGFIAGVEMASVKGTTIVWATLPCPIPQQVDKPHWISTLELNNFAA